MRTAVGLRQQQEHQQMSRKFRKQDLAMVYDAGYALDSAVLFRYYNTVDRRACADWFSGQVAQAGSTPGKCCLECILLLRTTLVNSAHMPGTGNAHAGVSSHPPFKYYVSRWPSNFFGRWQF